MNKSDNHSVAIIIINWNGKDVTIDCLESLKKVDYSPFKVYVVDNASTDDSVKEISEKHHWVTIIQSERNRFFGGGNNFGWQHVKKDNPEYLLFLNNDTEVAPDFLTHLANTIQSDSSIGMVGPKIYYYNKPNVIWSAGGYISFVMGKIAHYGLRQVDHGQCDKIREIGYLTGCAQLIRADIFNKVSGYDESYHMYTEDVDLCMRVKQLGFKIVYNFRSKIWHKISSSSGEGMTSYKVYNKIRSNFRFFRRYARFYHWITIPFFILLGVIYFFFSSLFRLKFKDLLCFIRGILSFTRKSKITR